MCVCMCVCVCWWFFCVSRFSRQWTSASPALATLAPPPQSGPLLHVSCLLPAGCPCSTLHPFSASLFDLLPRVSAGPMGSSLGTGLQSSEAQHNTGSFRPHTPPQLGRGTLTRGLGLTGVPFGICPRDRQRGTHALALEASAGQDKYIFSSQFFHRRKLCGHI